MYFLLIIDFNFDNGINNDKKKNTLIYIITLNFNNQHEISTSVTHTNGCVQSHVYLSICYLEHYCA